MKTILLPTDYSEVANNALRYSMELAKYTGAKIVLLHAYHIPVPSTEVPVLYVSGEELEAENKKRIEVLKNEVVGETLGRVAVEAVVRQGFAVDEIISVANEMKADLIAMGVTGAGKKPVLIGSNTTAVMKRTKVPVLVVPREAHFEKFKKIILACDYNGEIPDRVISRLEDFVRVFNSKVLVLDVLKPLETATYEKAVAGVTLEHQLRDVSHQLFFPAAQEVTEEINSFVDWHKGDLLVMVPHRHTVLQKIFHKSNTKRMAFHTHVPLLSIHD
jgi:nucleotide-binding universal stress UspA family protein